VSSLTDEERNIESRWFTYITKRAKHHATCMTALCRLVALCEYISLLLDAWGGLCKGNVREEEGGGYAPPPHAHYHRRKVTSTRDTVYLVISSEMVVRPLLTTNRVTLLSENETGGWRCDKPLHSISIV